MFNRVIIILCSLFVFVSCKQDQDREEVSKNEDMVALVRSEVLDEEPLAIKDESLALTTPVSDERPVVKAKKERLALEKEKALKQKALQNQKEESIILAKNEERESSKNVTIVNEKAVKVQKTQKEVVKNSLIDYNNDIESYIKVGTDIKGQNVSPRSPIKITVALLDNIAKKVDYQIYVVPKGKRLYRVGGYMIAYAYNIEFINGQSQVTFYWNGQNVYDRFLSKGAYSIYLFYKLKDQNNREISRDGRFWAFSQKYTINLN